MPKKIRSLKKVIQDGDLYLKKGEAATVSDAQAEKLIKAKHAEEVKAKE
jgi:hypothetical protein